MGNKKIYSKTRKHSRPLSRRLAQLKRNSVKGISSSVTIPEDLPFVESNSLEEGLSEANGSSETICDNNINDKPGRSGNNVQQSNVAVCSNNEQAFHPEGRRLVALDYFFEQILASKKHGACGCNITDMFILKENRLGLKSIITLKCKMCNIVMDVSTDYEESGELNVNDAAALGVLSSGIGYTTANEYMAILNVPFMAFGTFNLCQNNVADAIQSTLWAQIAENGKEEARLARIHGNVDLDEIPTISVIADGG